MNNEDLDYLFCSLTFCLTTHQSLLVILCHLPGKERKGIEKPVDERKIRYRSQNEGKCKWWCRNIILTSEDLAIIMENWWKLSQNYHQILFLDKSSANMLSNPLPAAYCKYSKSLPSGSALFAIKHVNLYQQPGSCNLIGWKLKWVWHLNLFIMTRVK